MKPLDKNLQQRVWDRVYPQKTGFSPQQRQHLSQSLRRAQANFQLWEELSRHPVYGDAFARMAKETGEHRKMLRQILEK